MNFSKIETIGVFALVCVCMSGCLVIGGKTHVCANSKESEQRIAQLESRINSLELHAGITPPKSVESNIAVASATTELPRQPNR